MTSKKSAMKKKTADSSTDVQVHKIEATLLESEARYRRLADHAPDIIFRYDISPTMKLAYINPAVQTITGYTPQDCYADPLLMMNMIHPDDMNLMTDYMQSLTPPSEPLIARWIGKDGTIRWMESRIVPIRDADGQLIAVEGITRDFTTRKQADEALRWNQSLLQLMSNSSPLGFLVVDNRTDNILYFNQRFCEIWGIQHLAERMRSGELKNNDIIPDCLPVLMDVPAFAESCKPLQYENNRVVVEDEIAFTESRTVRRFSTQIRGERDEYYGRFYIFEDISERKLAEAGLRQAKKSLETAHHELEQSFAREQQLARTDALTGVNSRGYLLELAAHEFMVAMRYKPPLSMLMVDIDRFKQVNDTFGHAIGDQAIKHIAQIVRAEIRSADIIGRYGAGDEFIILLPHTSTQEAMPLAERIHASVAAMHMETDLGALSVTLSVGIAQTIHDAAQPDTVENLFLRTDQALYAAKQAGRNRTVGFARE